MNRRRFTVSLIVLVVLILVGRADAAFIKVNAGDVVPFDGVIATDEDIIKLSTEYQIMEADRDYWRDYGRRRDDQIDAFMVEIRNMNTSFQEYKFNSGQQIKLLQDQVDAEKNKGVFYKITIGGLLVKIIFF